MGLRAKFNLVMLVALLAGLGLAAALSYRLALAGAQTQVMREAALMDAQADAIGRYTAEEIGPLLASQMARRFLPQSVPAWAAQTNFRTVQRQLPDYSFKVAMLNPTNPADKAEPWQAELVERLRADPSTKLIVLERETPQGRLLSIAKPVVITDPACLQCHSVPAAAPASMIDLYGSDNGFGWKLNEVLGTRIVSVPMSVPLARAQESFLVLLAWLGAVFVAMAVLLNLLLHFVIIRPVRAIAAGANEVSMGNMDAPEQVVRGRDEIASLAQSFNRMRRSLAQALKMLGE